MGYGAIFDIISKGMDWFTPKKRIERIKNEISKLEEEKRLLLLYKADIKKANRMGYIEHRLNELNGLLRNAAVS